jgi:hypothetical protein
MSDTPFATGGMSPEGTTTPVAITKPKLSIQDEAVICPIVCKCDKAPAIGADGRSLKQACVSKALNTLDAAADHKSPYKAEVNYDMTKRPPAPIMSSDPETKAHDWLPGWIKKWWNADESHPPFKPGKGLVRRPDIVIVNDPTRPPTQDNIKQVVEVKFPPDDWTKRQKDAYVLIADGENKVVRTGPDECDCDAPEPQGRSVIAPDAKTAGAAALILMSLGALILAPVGI